MSGYPPELASSKELWTKIQKSEQKAKRKNLLVKLGGYGVIAAVVLFFCFGISMSIKQSSDFASRCDALGGQTQFGKHLYLCISPDGRILLSQ